MSEIKKQYPTKRIQYNKLKLLDGINLIYFYSNFEFTAKLSRRYGDFPYTSCPHHMCSLLYYEYPLPPRVVYLLKPMNLH